MASLVDLPEELLALIAHDLPQYSWLAALCSVSKRCQARFEPYLYASQRFVFIFESAKFGLFMRTVFQRPELLIHIRSIVIQSFQAEAIYWTLSDSIVRELELKVYAVALAIPSKETSMKIASSAHQRGLGGFLAALLAITPNLTSLRIDYSMACYMGEVGAFFSFLRNAPASYKLSRLQRLETLWFPNKRAFAIHEYPPPRISIWSMFQLKSLKEIELVLSDSKAPISQQFLSRPSLLPDLRRLKISNTYGATGNEDLQDLLLILQASPNLTSLEYFLSQNVSRDSGNGDRIFKNDNYWGSFAEALRPYSATLKELTISAACINYEGPSLDKSEVEKMWSTRGRLKPLTFLRNLERLELPLFVLLGWRPANTPLLECIPRQVKELCLRDDLILYHPIEDYGQRASAELLDYLLCLVDLRTRGDTSYSIDTLHLYTADGKATYDNICRLEEDKSMVKVQENCEKAGIRCVIHMRMYMESHLRDDTQPYRLITPDNKIKLNAGKRYIKNFYKKAPVVWEKPKVFLI